MVVTGARRGQATPFAVGSALLALMIKLARCCYLGLMHQTNSIIHDMLGSGWLQVSCFSPDAELELTRKDQTRPGSPDALVFSPRTSSKFTGQHDRRCPSRVIRLLENWKYIPERGAGSKMMEASC